jgi:SAM-dependent methyltransferase
MSEDVFSSGFQRWEARFQEQDADQPSRMGDVAQEVRLAARLYREQHGEVGRAVDLGAGDGRHTMYLAQQGFDVLSVDGAPSGVALTRQKLERAGLAAELVVADLRAYNLPADIDLLVASYVIHLLPDPYTQIQKWQAAVRPGGMCLVSSRNRFDHDPAAYWFPADFELKRLFEEAGWFVLHAREEDNWVPDMGLHFRQRAVVATKPD